MPIPDEDAWIMLGEAEFLVPKDWRGRRRIVSECGWWIGEIHIVRFMGCRWLKSLEVYSLVFDEE